MTTKKVYINIPGAAEAGGVEALFQLADAINNLGGESIVIWDTHHSDPIPNKYKHYNIKHSLPIEDNSENWIIYPEVWTERIYEQKNMKRAIWWLSVDNNHNRFQDFFDDNIIHLYQSYYALDYLDKKGASNKIPLLESISDKYINLKYEIENKIDVVCYNPVKGRQYTNEIINLNPDIKFIPITNMDENEIIELLKISKVYIDFGHHPGRDRIPREAAILGNCVITNLNGAARFYNDIPILNKYKISDLNLVGGVIKECFLNFESSLNDFSEYRKIISNQKNDFNNQIKENILK